jgi:hypothetical protein
MPQPPDESCGSCQYFMPQFSTPFGIFDFCRRHPPQPIYDKDTPLREGYQSAWPQTKAEYWCGEYSRAIVST